MAHLLITREVGRGDELRGALERLGHQVTHVPLIATEALSDAPIALEGYDWVIVTSAVGARELRRRATGPWPRRAAIGAATAEALGGAELVPAVSSQEGLLAEFPRPPGRVLFAAAEGARRLLVERLGADFLPLYRTTELAPDDLPAADLAVVASPSAALALARLQPGRAVVSIGPQTTRQARELGLQVRAEAAQPSLQGVLDAVRRACSADG